MQRKKGYSCKNGIPFSMFPLLWRSISAIIRVLKKHLTKRGIYMSNEQKEFEKYYNLASNHNITFGQHMQKLLQECNITDKFDFQERTKLSPHFYLDIQKDNYVPSMKTLVSICIGLELDIGMANILLASLARSFKIESRRDYAYQYVIQYHSGLGIETANGVLRELGFKGDDLLGSRDNI